jgi:hypothetical protein
VADNTENIGGVNVTVGVDLSDLQAGFEQAQTDAQAAGTAIADAFSSGSTGLADFDAAIQEAVTASDSLASSADSAGAAVDGAGEAANTAAGDVQNFGAASETAGAQAAEGANSFSSMAEKLTLIGEALIITEGLKEFGTDALEAADNVTHASIALTQLDGSAAAAQSTISGLEELGMSDGLSFPSLLVAGTRMTAILGPGVDVSNLLGQIANGAAVMGTDITSATTRFDQMATAGTASARTLTSLGLSLGSLAAALNTVSGNQDATAASAAAMFKALDQSDRITVLQTALEGLAGTAEKTAQSTFGGQWQELANSWDSLMVEAGQDLLPVIAELVNFTKVEIVPFLKDMLAGFTALPAPVQQIVIGVGLFAAALIPVSAALAAVGLGITGLNTLLASLGITSAEAATGTEGLAAAQTEAVASAEGLAAAEGEVAVSEETAAATTTASSASIATAIGGRILLYGALAAALLDLYGAYEKEQQAEQGAAAQNTELYTSLNKLEGLMVSQGIDIQDLTAKYASGKITIDQLLSSLNQLEVGYVALHGSSQTGATDAGAMTASMTALIAKVNSQNDAVQQAKINLDALTSAYNNNRTMADGTVVTAQLVTAAQNQLNTALTASGQAINDNIGYQDHLQSATDISAAAAQFLVDQNASLTTAIDTAGQALGNAQEKLDDLAATYGVATTDLGKYAALYPDLATALQNAAKAQDTYVLAIGKAAPALLAQQQAQDAVTAADLRYDALQVDLMANAAAAAGANDLVVAALRDMATGLLDASNSFIPYKAQVVSSPSALEGMSGALADAKARLADVTAQWEAGKTSAQSYLNAVKAVTNTQEAYDVAQAEAAANTSGSTDAVSLYTSILAGAQAKLTDVTNDYLNQTATAQQLLSAQKAVTTAQNDLNSAVAAAQNPLANAATGMKNVANANSAGVPAINNVTAAINQEVVSLQNLASAFQSATAASNAAWNSDTFNLSNSSGIQGQTGNADSTQVTSQTINGVVHIIDGLGWQDGVLIGSLALGIPGSKVSVAQIKAYQAQQSGVSAASTSTPASTSSAGTTSTGTGGVDQAPIIISPTPSGSSPTSTATTGGATDTTSTATASGGTILVDEVSSGTLYGQLDNILTALTGGTFSALTSATQTLASATTSNTAATTASITATDSAAAASDSISSTLQAVGTSIAGLSTSTQALSDSVGKMQTLNLTSTQSAANATAGNVTQSAANVTQPAANTVVVGAPIFGALGGTGTDSNTNSPNAQTVNMHFEGATFGAGVTAAQVATAVTPMVMQAMTQVLRTSGARF